jgi:transglutaminase-like putative cysteine protease/sugar lactone lactonase YvrE
MKAVVAWLCLSVAALPTVAGGHPGEEVARLPSPYSCPTGLAFDGENLWVADHKEDKLTCVDPQTGEVLREVPSPGFWPMGLAWDGTYLWNADLRQGRIFQVDPSDGTILRVIGAPSDGPEGLTWDGNTLWISDPLADEIAMLDLSDGTAVETFPAAARHVQGMAFDGNYLWCADRMADEIHMVDPESGEVIVVLDAPGPYPRGLAWDGRHLWCADYQTDSLYCVVREDDELYRLGDTRKARITYTHEVKAYGEGILRDLDVYIAIPESLPRQRILRTAFAPNDYRSVRDGWWQPIAHFSYEDLASGATIQSMMTVDAEISGIDYFVFPERCGTLSDTPGEIRRTYTADGSKYGTGDPYVQELVERVVGDEQNPYWVARKVFDYVRESLEFERAGGWNVASAVLKRGSGSCSEYTFVFIALCRAAGLPARYVGSVVVRGDDASLDDVYHRWAEVYLPNYGWIPIDPSAGDTNQPRDRAMSIGHLSNRYLVTTRGGGDSEYLGWYYNSNEAYTADPQLQVNVEAFGEWEPLTTERDEAVEEAQGETP